MSQKKIFVKVSGDQFRNSEFLDWVVALCRRAYVAVCVGGGTQIKEEFRRYGLDPNNYGPLGRETNTPQERQIARQVLERNQIELQDLLATRGVYPTVMIPILDIGGVSCQVNGDQCVVTAYLGYDELFVITLPERKKTKRQQFAHLPKVQIEAF